MTVGSPSDVNGMFDAMKAAIPEASLNTLSVSIYGPGEPGPETFRFNWKQCLIVRTGSFNKMKV